MGVFAWSQFRSTDLGRDPPCEFEVAFGVNLRRVGFGVAEQHLCRLQPVLLANASRERVTKLIRMPAAGLAPRLHLIPLALVQPRPPFGGCLVLALRQWRGRG